MKNNGNNVYIFFGDSIVYGLHDKKYGGWVNRIRCKVEKKSKNNFFFNMGIPGQNLNNVLRRIKVELNNRYNNQDTFHLIFSVGIKDSLLLNNDSNYIKKIEKKILKIINISKKYTNNIYYIGLIKPDVIKRKEYKLKNVKTIDNCIENLCKKFSIKYIKIYNMISKENLYDGLHPNEEGHKIMSELLYKKLCCEEYYESR